MFIESEFILNHLFTLSNAVTIFVWKSNYVTSVLSELIGLHKIRNYYL
jgi:hypothetical protein